MRGISEKKLREWKRKSVQLGLNGIKSDELLDLIIKDCEELNDWNPINENTPKDRRIMLFYENYGMHTGEFKCGHYLADAGLCVPCNIKPKYWQELPSLPKE